jgi:hypothetical protein
MRERSVLCALLILTGCAHPPAPPPAAHATDVAPATVIVGADEIVWPGATADDLRLAAEVIGLTRDAFDATLPAAAPSASVAVRFVVTDEPQPVGSAYLLVPREIRIERRYVSRLDLAHETAHALLHGRLGFPAPVWFDEAVAQLVAYRVLHGEDLPPPPGRPIGDFAALRALTGASWKAAGGEAYASAAQWLGYLLPSGPATDAEKAAFARFEERLFAGHDAAAADAELRAIDAAPRR